MTDQVIVFKKALNNKVLLLLGDHTFSFLEKSGAKY